MKVVSWRTTNSTIEEAIASAGFVRVLNVPSCTCGLPHFSAPRTRCSLPTVLTEVGKNHSLFVSMVVKPVSSRRRRMVSADGVNSLFCWKITMKCQQRLQDFIEGENRPRRPRLPRQFRCPVRRLPRRPLLTRADIADGRLSVFSRHRITWCAGGGRRSELDLVVRKLLIQLPLARI